MSTYHQKLTRAVLAIGLAFGLASGPTFAKEDVYWTTDADVAKTMPDKNADDHGGWTKSPTTGPQAHKMNVPDGTKVYVAFLNEDRGDRKTVELRLTAIAEMDRFRYHASDSAGYTGSDDSSGTTRMSKDSRVKIPTLWKINFAWPKQCPKWERLAFTNTTPNFVLVTVDATSTCSCSSGSTGRALDASDTSFGTEDGVSEPMQITEIEVYPIMADVDAGLTPPFSAPPHTGEWTQELSFVDPEGESRPGGGARFATDGPGLAIGELCDFGLTTTEHAYGLYWLFAFDAVSEEWQRYLYDFVDPPWAERFDMYEADAGLIDRRDWIGWNGNEELDAIVSDAQARSGSNSLAVSGDTDIVRSFSEVDSGQWKFSAWCYVPQAMDDEQYFVLLNTYPTAWPDGWSLAIQIDGSDGVVRDHETTEELPLVRDAWTQIEVSIDLDHDVQRVFYGGDLLTTREWTSGYGGDGVPSIAAVDLWGNGSAHTVFYDDFVLEPCNPAPESFEPYADGSMLHGQGGWKGWNDDPAFSSPVTSARARTGEQSVDVFGPGTMVHDYCTFGEGAWSYSAWQYIPSGFESGGGGEMAGTYFMLLNTYQDGGPYDFSVQMQFDSTDHMLKVYHGDGGNTINVPYETDRWVKIQTIVDLDNDWTQVYYDDELIAEYEWTGGVYGDGGGALDIAAVDLYAQHSTNVYYDDLVLEPILPAPPCDGDVNGSGEVGFDDVLDVLAAWGECGGCPEDLDDDGFVGFGDLLIVLGAWGPCE